MSWISKLKVAIPFPSLGKGPVSPIPKGKITFIRRQYLSKDIFDVSKAQEVVRQGRPPINRARKIIKNSVTFYKIK